MAHLSEHDRWTIVSLHEQGLSTADIHRQHGWKKDTIRRWIRHYEQNGDVADAPRPGRPTKITRTVQREIRQQMVNQQRRSTRYMAHRMRRQQIANVSYRTVQRAAHNMGLQPYHIRYQPNITPAIAQRRIAYSHAYAQQDWRVVVFCDEKKFQLFKRGHSRNDVVWSFSPTQIEPRRLVRNAPSVTVWAGISYNGKTALHFYRGTVDSAYYIQILQTTLIPSAQRLYHRHHWTLLHDGATAHIAAATRQWMDAQHISYIPPIDYPSNSPDFNPIENIWSILNEKIQARRLRTTDGLRTAIQEEWNNLDINVIRKTIDSIPARLLLCIERQGAYTQ